LGSENSGNEQFFGGRVSLRERVEVRCLNNPENNALPFLEIASQVFPKTGKGFHN